MSWGHATSVDLISWDEQPVAILCDAEEDIYSGSIVIDQYNTSGLGNGDTAPLVAIYTSAYKDSSARRGTQAQSLAWNSDGGYTWTKYQGSPVLDRNSADFRDPKVFRYNGPPGSYWVMVAVEADEHKVVIYSPITFGTGTTSAASDPPTPPAASGSAPTFSLCHWTATKSRPNGFSP